MKIANGVEVLELKTIVMGRESIIYPTLIWDKDTAILVDAGFPGQGQYIREAVEKAGVAFNKLNKVIITHQDIDHIGALPEMLTISENKIEVIAHEIEKPHIQGDKPLLKADPERLKKLEGSIPEEQLNRMKELFKNSPKAKVDTTVEDGEELPYCGGIKVIWTPGHTTGHICLYLKQSKTLITGDAIVLADGQLFGPRPQMTANMDEATKSLKKLVQYDIETVVCYHGGIFNHNANQRIAELANS